MRSVVLVSIALAVLGAQANQRIHGIRLVAGNGRSKGKVEVKVTNRWASLCVRTWRLQEARIACRMLGFNRSFVRPASGDFYVASAPGEASVYSLSLESTCTGTEDGLEECMGGYFGFIECDRLATGGSFRTGVDCEPEEDWEVPLRLVGGETADVGVIQTFHNNTWGTVCGNHFGLGEAKVICGKLGYIGNGVEPFTVHQKALSAQENTSIHLEELHCSGEEESVSRCEHRPWGDALCRDGLVAGQIAGVRCNTVSNSLSVRLIGGESDHEGWVQLDINGRWANLLDRKWDGQEATVVCKMLGFRWGSNEKKNYRVSTSGNPVWRSKFDCTGEESSILNCPHQILRYGFTSNSSMHGAVASCYTDTPPTGPILTGRMELWENQTTSLWCEALGGAVDVTLKLFCLHSLDFPWKSSSGRNVSLELSTLPIGASDNGNPCYCIASNERGWKVTVKREFNITFGPGGVRLHQYPGNVKIGDKILFTCDSGESNPAVNLRWYIGTTEFHVPYRLRYLNGVHGTSTYQQWETVADASMNYDIISCVAQNPMTNRTDFDSKRLVFGTRLPVGSHLALTAHHSPSFSSSFFLELFRSSMSQVFEDRQTSK